MESVDCLMRMQNLFGSEIDVRALSQSSASPHSLNRSQSSPYGVLESPQTVKPPLIKPVAFKPVVAACGPHRYTTAPTVPTPLRACPPLNTRNLSRDEGYGGSQDGRPCPVATSTPPLPPHPRHTPAPLSRPRSPGTYSKDALVYSELSAKSACTDSTSLPSPSHGCYSSGECPTGTPSPSDSGLGEVENMLRDKDAEIAHLRSTLEQNETAILRVYEEKRQAWEAELREAGCEWEKVLRQQQQRALKMEQALLLQLFRLQQDRKALGIDVEELRTERCRAESQAEDVTANLMTLRAQHDDVTIKIKNIQEKLEETQWEMQQKMGEISHLKSQLKESKEDASCKNTELVTLRGQLRDTTQTSKEKDAEIDRLQGEVEMTKQESSRRTTECESLRIEVGKCRKQHATDNNNTRTTDTTNSQNNEQVRITDLDEVRTTPTDYEVRLKNYEKEKKEHEAERVQWLEEKNKVIRYQKHLQLNYVQMYRKNKVLEREVEQLMVEIDNKDLRLEEGAPQESTC